MLFSYGFIDGDLGYTSALTLGLTIAEDDLLKRAKEAVSSAAAAVRLTFDSVSTQ